MLKFSISRTVATLPLTLYALGLAFGPLFTAPLSEALGRRPIYIASVALLLAFTGGASAAQNLATLLACRFLAGFFGSAGVAIGAGTLADVWDGEPAQGPASILFILGPFLGPTLAPIASAYTLYDQDNDWRWTQWLVLLIGAPAMVGVVLMSETSVVKPSSEKTQQRVSLGSTLRILRTAVARPTRMLFTEIVVASLTLYTAFAYAMIFSYFSSASYVLPRYYGFNIREVGLSFIAVIIGYLLATVLFAVSDKTLYARAAAEARARGTQPSPKHRLYSAMVGSLLLPVGLFW